MQLPNMARKWTDDREETARHYCQKTEKGGIHSHACKREWENIHMIYYSNKLNKIKQNIWILTKTLHTTWKTSRTAEMGSHDTAYQFGKTTFLMQHNRRVKLSHSIKWIEFSTRVSNSLRPNGRLQLMQTYSLLFNSQKWAGSTGGIPNRS